MCVCVCVCVCVQAQSVMSNSSQPHGLQPTRLLCPWDFPGKHTGVGCHFLLQGIFLTLGLNLCLLHHLYWQVDFLPSEPLGKPPECKLTFYQILFFASQLLSSCDLEKEQRIYECSWGRIGAAHIQNVCVCLFTYCIPK